MTSWRNTRAQINAVQSVRHVPTNGVTLSRSVWKAKRRPNELNTIQYGKAELDSRADTCCAGMDFTVIEHTGTTCEVHPYHPKYKPGANVPLVKAVTAYDHNGNTYILVLNQALYFGDEMPNSLLNPNQIRFNGIIVDDLSNSPVSRQSFDPFHMLP
jgi:hypothetical protein